MLSLGLAFLAGSVIGNEVKIMNVDDFIKFKDEVNKGTNYSGTTVLLGSDLSFAGKTFEPIGYYNSDEDFNCFLGVFDGQGHVISNLKMASSLSHAGLFGYSRGLTIRNVILDPSCSITSSFSGSGSSAFIGGIIGECNVYDGPCIIENSVNMGRVSFSGNVVENGLTLGGIAGGLVADEYVSTVKNCANYGELTHSGTSEASYVGGIIGSSSGYSEAGKKTTIYNSFNYGTITYEGTTTSEELHIGGIAGIASYTTIENCVSFGKFSLPTTVVGNIGSIAGSVYDKISVNYTYFTSDLSSYKKYGDADPSPVESNVLSYDSNSFELSESVSIGEYIGKSLVGALNAAADYYVDSEYSHWLLNKDNKDVSFTINKNKDITVSTQVILMPSLAAEAKQIFDGWYTDDEHTTPFTESEVTKDTSLYGLYGLVYIVAFDKNGGESVSFDSKKVVLDNTYGKLPEATKTGNTLAGWFTAKDGGNKVESTTKVMILGNHTLYAHWTINKYTLRFDANNGEKPEVRTLDYNATVVYPANPKKNGYIFVGWDRVIDVMPAYDLTITAMWVQDSGNNSDVTLILAIVLPIVVFVIAAVIIAVLLVLYIRLKKKFDQLNRGGSGFSKPLIEAGGRY